MAKMESYTALGGARISCRRIDMRISPFIFTSTFVGCVVSGDHLTERAAYSGSTERTLLEMGSGLCSMDSPFIG